MVQYILTKKCGTYTLQIIHKGTAVLDNGWQLYKRVVLSGYRTVLTVWLQFTRAVVNSWYVVHNKPQTDISKFCMVIVPSVTVSGSRSHGLRSHVRCLEAPYTAV